MSVNWNTFRGLALRGKGLRGKGLRGKAKRRLVTRALPKPILVLVTIVIAMCVQSATTLAQLPEKSVTGGPTAHPIVPGMGKRPAPSPLEYRNLINRPDNDQDSISSLVQNVKDQDALIEVVVGRGRLVTLQTPLAVTEGDETPVVAVGDPTVLDFDILPNSQMIRLLGKRVGVTDLSVVTADGKAYTFEVRVTYDLNLLRAYIRQQFPNTSISIVQMFEHVIVEGEASSTEQVYNVIETIRSFLVSSQVTSNVKGGAGAAPDDQPAPAADEGGDQQPGLEAGPESKPSTNVKIPAFQIINLLRVPGVQQIMLQVQVVEVNRTALRRMGASIAYRDSSGRLFGHVLGSGGTTSLSEGGADTGILRTVLGAGSTAFAVLPNTSIAATIDALRQNGVTRVLAEPNLMAMHGQTASFLAGGEFPVPVSQGGAVAGAITIEYKDFGVLLDFVPYIMDNGAIRLHVAPEVSDITSVPVPGSDFPAFLVNSRRADTTVELRQGQTLALAGLLTVELEAQTQRLPGLGDLPYLGPFFSNNSHQKEEKELLILVSPHFVDAMDSHQVAPLPGCEIRDPDDHEFYWLNRIENRNPNVNYRATNSWDDPLQLNQYKRGRQFIGPFGFSR